MNMSGAIEIGRAELSDQGKLGPLLLSVYGPAQAGENAAAEACSLPVSSLEDEFMAADDFYFSVIDLMDCCYLARSEGKPVGAACVNPYVSELQYVAVAPEWRRRGIGRKLAELALAELARRGCDHVRIDVCRGQYLDGAREFLAALGFNPVRESVVMGKRMESVRPPVSDEDPDEDAE